MKKKITLIILIFLISCTQNISKKNDEMILKQYKGALETFYSYIDKLNNNELNEENMKKIFNETFSFSGSPNLNFSNINDLTTFYNSIRNETYPFICSPDNFNILKFEKLSLLPLTENSVMLSLLDVFHCSDKKIPRYKMSFIYTLIFDVNKNTWLMNNLIEILPENYPEDWIKVKIKEKVKYDGKVEIKDLITLQASKLAKGEK